MVSFIIDKHFIVRVAWVFALNGKNFIKIMINTGKTHDTVRVVNVQMSTPTYTLDFARLLVNMIKAESTVIIMPQTMAVIFLGTTSVLNSINSKPSFLVLIVLRERSMTLLKMYRSYRDDSDDWISCWTTAGYLAQRNLYSNRKC